MPLLHIVNTNFEFELKQNNSKSIRENWSENPLCLQLQFLPLLFADSDDYIAITQFPEPGYLEQLKQILKISHLPKLVLLEQDFENPSFQCVSWGPSKQIESWTKQKGLIYSIPKDWNMLQKINSKAFSFAYSPLKEASLLHNKTELNHWLQQTQNPKVLKTCFGLSGIGHLIIDETTDLNRIQNFCQKEWQLGHPLIAEPWVKRLFDFSTQWYLFADGTFELFGPTVFETRANGRYIGTFAGKEEPLFGKYLPFLYEHIEAVKAILKDLSQLGYFGHIGVDALLYWCEQENKTKLYPIVEINGRQTLSLVALRLQQMHYSNHNIYLSFEKKSTVNQGLLPSTLGTINFQHNLVLKI